jgi:MraZ protein
MSTEPIVESPTFNSVYQHGVDEKRRLAIPAKWRPRSEAFEFTLVLFPSQVLSGQHYLLGLTPEIIQDLKRKLREQSIANGEAESLRRYLGINAENVSLDKAGRIVLPEQLAKGAGISEKATLVGTWDRFEIWNPDAFEEAKKQDMLRGPLALKLI